MPAACFPRGIPGAQRRRRRRLGFIYADRRARPGNRDTEAFSCFPAAWPRRRTSCGRGIHVPGPAGESPRARPSAGPAVNPRRGDATAGATGSPQRPSPPSPAGLAGAGHKGPLPSPFGEKFSEGPQVALEAERLRCKSRVLAGSSVGNFTTNGWAGETTAYRAPFMFLAISRSELRPRFAPVGRERTSRAAWTLGASVPVSLGFGGPGCLKTGHTFTSRGSRWSG